jgi:hypothetical protein
VGADGSVVLVGTTTAVDFPATAGVVQPKIMSATCVTQPPQPGTINPGIQYSFPCSTRL